MNKRKVKYIFGSYLLGPGHWYKRTAFELVSFRSAVAVAAAAAGVISTGAAAAAAAAIVFVAIPAAGIALAEIGVEEVSAVQDAPESHDPTPSHRPHHDQPGAETQIRAVRKSNLD